MIPLRDVIPSRTTPVVTISLIVLNVLVFLYEFSLGEKANEFIIAFGLIPAAFSWVTLLTSMFLHGGFLHCAGNMLYLWIFGDNVEDSMGHVRYVIFYVFCGVAAVLAQALPDPTSEVPMIGASGAISGVLGAYLLLFPNARIHVLIPLGIVMQSANVRAMWVLLFWFALQLVSSIFQGGEGAGVAFRAHIGGFVAGMALVPLLKYRNVRLFAP
jgi:membrane associated rhomboid family serine protease